MNSIAEFVFRTGKSPGKKRFLWSLAGALFWYGAVAVMIIISPWVDRQLGLKLPIPLSLRLTVGIVLFLVGIPMVAWTITRLLRTKGTPIPFNPPPTLVINGLYRYVRNPMHLGWTIVLLGVAILEQSFTLLVIFIPLFLLVHIIYIKLVEEKELEKKFGQPYVDYKKKVPMFIPKLPRA